MIPGHDDSRRPLIHSLLPSTRPFSRMGLQKEAPEPAARLPGTNKTGNQNIGPSARVHERCTTAAIRSWPGSWQVEVAALHLANRTEPNRTEPNPVFIPRFSPNRHFSVRATINYNTPHTTNAARTPQTSPRQPEPQKATYTKHVHLRQGLQRELHNLTLPHQSCRLCSPCCCCCCCSCCCSCCCYCCCYCCSHSQPAALSP